MSIKCPNCGAPAALGPGQSAAQCSYCGSALRVTALSLDERISAALAVDASGGHLISELEAALAEARRQLALSTREATTFKREWNEAQKEAAFYAQKAGSARQRGNAALAERNRAAQAGWEARAEAAQARYAAQAERLAELERSVEALQAGLSDVRARVATLTADQSARAVDQLRDTLNVL